jgi:hypothetical protein
MHREYSSLSCSRFNFQYAQRKAAQVVDEIDREIAASREREVSQTAAI